MELVYKMNTLLLHGITRCSQSMLWVSCIEMTWLFFNTYEIHQIHVLFYLASAYKPRCYQYMTIAPYAYLHVTGWQMMVCPICMLQLLHRITLIGSFWISFLHISVDIATLVYFRVQISLVFVGVTNFVVLYKFVGVSSS